ncbi:MAG: LysE family translocator [Cocleimonas sp.]|nr:LysE family translocator [Cocleimonas sp.]
MSEINYVIIVIAALLSIASPGPATLAIASTSMSHGRTHGSVLAFGITTGGLVWSTSAAFGLSSFIYTNAWLFELMRYVGASYLLYLAYKSSHIAISHTNNKIEILKKSSLKSTYFKGLALQLSNPKAILFFASFYAVILPPNTTPKELLMVIATISITGNILFQTYAYIFSISKVCDTYINLRRYFEAFFAVFFAFAGLKVLTSKLD